MQMQSNESCWIFESEMAVNPDEIILDKVDECYRSMRATAPPLFRCKHLDTAQTADSLAQLELLLTNWGLRELFPFFVCMCII